MQYEFFYRIKDGKEHILYKYSDENGNTKTDIINSTEKLVDFIKRHCVDTCDVYFINFEEDKVNFILTEILDTMEINYPPIGYEGPFQMFKRLPKVRGLM